MGQDIDYAAVLADLESKRAALDAAIAAVRAILGQAPNEAPGGPGGGLSSTPGTDLPSEVTPGIFHSMSVSEAAKKYLEMKKVKQKTRALCDALSQGGIESDSKNFYGNVYTTLTRNKDFMRRGKYWALASWFPNVPASKPTKKGRAKRGRKTTAPAGDKRKVVDISSGGEKAETA